MMRNVARPGHRLLTPGAMLWLAVIAGYCLLALFPIVKRRSMRVPAPVKVPAGKPAVTCMPLPLPTPVAVKLAAEPDCVAVQGVV